ncbi:MAG: hypothetical protein VKK43_00555 [Synechococcaceae cyanobacterium]|nr:hypothetical protein [Synechococcaceae cyanobacterium]
MTPTPSSHPSDGRGPLRLVVALTPLAGSLAFPIVVPLLMVRVSLSAGMLAAVVIGSLWFVAMLRTSEMPAQD